jgi:hypothetical protein
MVRVVWWWGYGILLGPERTSHVSVLGAGLGFVFSGAVRIGHQTRPRRPPCFGGFWLVWVVLWWCGFCVLFENCIVDASIFVVKLLRANGGCLGTRSR